MWEFIASQHRFDITSTTILTPNRRLAARLHQQYQTQQLAQQNPCWRTPDILPINSWLRRLWEEYTSNHIDKLLLNTMQEQDCWEKILAQSPAADSLLQPAETADGLKSAWKLIKQWEIDLHHPIFATAEEYVTFQQWLLTFQTHCEKNNVIDEASLVDLLIKKIQTNKIILPKKIILVGFIELSPQLTTLFSACKQTGGEIIQLAQLNAESATSTSPPLAQAIACLDADSEILTMARFAKSIITQHPQATIGCVIPTLDKIRDRVAAVFSDVLQQQTLFNISAGKKLIQYPIIAAVFSLLTLHKKSIPFTLFSDILASAFVGEAETERARRANFDVLLRKKNMYHIQLDTLLQEDRVIYLKKYCPRLAKRLHAFLQQLPADNTYKTYHEWIIFFNNLLSQLGWPGERSLNSEEFQVIDNWLSLLSDMTTLDYFAQPVPFATALQKLHYLATKHVFQPKTPDAPIQVLGILEAAALPFDYLWVSGMDNVSWPAPPKPNPFIPKKLQRELHMPHATAEREWQYAEQLIQQFKHSAAQSIFSYTEKNEELTLQASALISDLPVLAMTHLNLAAYQSAQERSYQTKNAELICDEIAPPLTADAHVITHGGVNIIKQQAACPFKAFAEWRLHAQPLEQPLPGLPKKDRGTIVHMVLESLWKKIATQATLITLSDQDLRHLINTCIEETLSPLFTLYQKNKKYLQLEKKRLHDVVYQWLQIEKEREPFTVINQETTVQMTLHTLTFSMRIDRIDELMNGKKLIIDYKTSKELNVDKWFDARLEEPQLPLYALVDSEKTAGISYAQLTAGKYTFKGISQYELSIKGIKNIAEQWPQQLTQWQTYLSQLSHDFSQGIATIDPKDRKETCEYCELKPFCRVAEHEFN